jgi:HD-GYP domain-containing protein (c-di-GMP phosphodiesterase class II)
VFGDDDSLNTYAAPFRYGTRAEMAMGMMRAVAPPTAPSYRRAWRLARHLPRLALGFQGVIAATCEVARMLTEQLGVSSSVARLFDYESERWDGKGMPAGVAGDAISLPVRIAQVALDATFQRMLGDTAFVADLIGRRGGHAFDPDVAKLFAAEAAELLADDGDTGVWDAVLAREPTPHIDLKGAAVDQALAATGHFADMAIIEFVGHSGGVAKVCRTAAPAMSLDQSEQRMLVRAALIHDLGRVGVPVRVWGKQGPLGLDDWERVRLHAYQTERILAHSPYLAGLGAVAGLHHERFDGSGYHRGVAAESLGPSARLLAAADAYHAMTEPRPHRAPLAPGDAADALTGEVRSGHLAPEAVAAVLDSTGHRVQALERPAGLTERELQVVSLLARGLQTKQIARRLGISAKTADFHIQKAYRKMEVSTRAGATLFAMQHGLVTWENSR